MFLQLLKRKEFNKMDKIIISLEVYNFHLFISYLGEGIDIIRFDNFQSAFHKVDMKNLNYIEEINSGFSSYTEVNFNKNKLFAIENSKVFSQNLFDELDKKILLLEDDFEQIYIDKEQHRIDLLTSKNFIKSLNTQSLNEKRVQSNFSSIDEDMTVSNMKSVNKNVYLAIRGFGAKRINSNNESIIFRTEDAQDIEILKKNEIIAIADAFEGVILYNLNGDSKPLRKIKFDSDIIQEIKVFQNNFILKGKNGLYLYDYIYDKKIQIFEGSIGAFTSYYDMIFFTHKNKVNMISKDKSSIKQFRLMKEKIDIDINQRNKNYR